MASIAGSMDDEPEQLQRYWAWSQTPLTHADTSSDRRARWDWGPNVPKQTKGLLRIWHHHNPSGMSHLSTAVRAAASALYRRGG